MSEALQRGDRVRVKSDCPHTLPHYARVLIGRVQGVFDDGQVDVVFGEHAHPMDPQWLYKVDDPEATVETSVPFDDED